MKELSRLVDDRDEPELARLFRAGRAPAPLPRAAFERSRRRVLALAAPATLGMVALIQHAALGAALGTATAVVVALPRLLAEPSAAPSAAPHPAPSVTVPQARAAAPRVERAPEALPSAAAEATASFEITRLPAPSSSSTEHLLVRETRLLERARAELAQRPERCLALLSEHALEFPSGALALEREFLTVASLVQLGRRAEAEARAEALRARSPGSLYEERLERLLGETP
jgi:hypothetical protein